MTNEILIKSAIRTLVNEQVKQGSWGYALEEDSAYEVSWNDVLKWLEQQPREDCISRADILDAIETWDKFGVNAEQKLIRWQDHYVPYVHLDDVRNAIANMPSVTPQVKATGSWVEKQVVDNEEVEIEQWQSARCSKCGKYHTTPYSYYFDDYSYCPNCGAKMESEDVE